MIEYSKNALKVYEKLYLKRDSISQKIIETIAECNKRVSDFLAKDDFEAQEFFDLLQTKSFRINTPAMVNAGVEPEPNLAACFLLGLDDSIDSIIEMWGTCAKVYAGGGGAGICITNLREQGSPLKIGGYSSGPISFMRTIQSISEQVKSGGRARRAANLISFDYKHPDALQLTTCKAGNDDFSAINISMCADEEFMKNIDSDAYIPTKSPNRILKDKKFNILKYKDLWNTLIDCAWENGDPGLLFIDRMNQNNPFPSRGLIETTNPCGEVCLAPWSACDLGHLNLNNFIQMNGNELKFSDDFKSAIDIGVRFLNRIIDRTVFPNKKFKETMLKNRPIGLGIMGFADILYKAGIPYDSKDARELLRTIIKLITKTAFRSSIKLAEEEEIKVQIPSKDREHFLTLLKNYDLSNADIEKVKKTGIANCTVTTLAPTGSTAISADASYSFEPIFSLAWEKNVSDSNDTWYFIDPNFQKYCDDNGIKLTKELSKKISDNNGSIRGLSEFELETQKIFCTAHDISWNDRLKMQASAQEYVTLSISSTVNLKHSATKDDVSSIYKQAYILGLKGITVYRDGSRDGQPINFSSNGSKKETSKKGLTRPMIRYGKTLEVNTPRGKLYITGNYFNGTIIEVFISMGHQGHFDNTLLNTIGRLISKSLQLGVPLDKLTDTMRGAGGEVMFVKVDDNDERARNLTGIVDLIATVLDEHFEKNEMSNVAPDTVSTEGYDRCPQCSRFTLTKSVGCRGGSCINPDCLYSCCI